MMVTPSDDNNSTTDPYETADEQAPEETTTTTQEDGRIATTLRTSSSRVLSPPGGGQSGVVPSTALLPHIHVLAPTDDQGELVVVTATTPGQEQRAGAGGSAQTPQAIHTTSSQRDPFSVPFLHPSSPSSSSSSSSSSSPARLPSACLILSRRRTFEFLFLYVFGCLLLPIYTSYYFSSHRPPRLLLSWLFLLPLICSGLYWFIISLYDRNYFDAISSLVLLTPARHAFEQHTRILDRTRLQEFQITLVPLTLAPLCLVCTASVVYQSSASFAAVQYMISFFLSLSSTTQLSGTTTNPTTITSTFQATAAATAATTTQLFPASTHTSSSTPGEPAGLPTTASFLAPLSFPFSYDYPMTMTTMTSDRTTSTSTSFPPQHLGPNVHSGAKGGGRGGLLGTSSVPFLSATTPKQPSPHQHSPTSSSQFIPDDRLSLFDLSLIIFNLFLYLWTISHILTRHMYSDLFTKYMTRPSKYILLRLSQDMEFLTLVKIFHFIDFFLRCLSFTLLPVIPEVLALLSIALSMNYMFTFCVCMTFNGSLPENFTGALATCLISSLPFLCADPDRVMNDARQCNLCYLLLVLRLVEYFVIFSLIVGIQLIRPNDQREMSVVKLQAQPPKQGSLTQTERAVQGLARQKGAVAELTGTAPDDEDGRALEQKRQKNIPNVKEKSKYTTSSNLRLSLRRRHNSVKTNCTSFNTTNNFYENDIFDQLQINKYEPRKNFTTNAPLGFEVEHLGDVVSFPDYMLRVLLPSIPAEGRDFSEGFYGGNALTAPNRQAGTPAWITRAIDAAFFGIGLLLLLTAVLAMAHPRRQKYFEQHNAIVRLSPAQVSHRLQVGRSTQRSLWRWWIPMITRPSRPWRTGRRRRQVR